VWPLLLSRELATSWTDGARDVRGMEVLGDTAIAFTLTEPLAIFPKFLAMPVASVVPPSVLADFGQRPVGTGAWRLRRVAARRLRCALPGMRATGRSTAE